MEKIKVIFRKYDGNIIAFLPELPANYGNIMCYQHIGQHGEASVQFYHDTEKASEAEYAPLYAELQEIYNDCQLVIRQRLCYNDVTEKAWALVKSLNKMARALEEA